MGVNFTICVGVNVTPPIFMCWDLNSVPRAGIAASLPTKPPTSPASLVNFVSPWSPETNLPWKLRDECTSIKFFNSLQQCVLDTSKCKLYLKTELMIIKNEESRLK